jgi:hypothetical protein
MPGGKVRRIRLVQRGELLLDGRTREALLLRSADAEEIETGRRQLRTEPNQRVSESGDVTQMIGAELPDLGLISGLGIPVMAGHGSDSGHHNLSLMVSWMTRFDHLVTLQTRAFGQGTANGVLWKPVIRLFGKAPRNPVQALEVIGTEAVPGTVYGSIYREVVRAPQAGSWSDPASGISFELQKTTRDGADGAVATLSQPYNPNDGGATLLDGAAFFEVEPVESSVY